MGVGARPLKVEAQQVGAAGNSTLASSYTSNFSSAVVQKLSFGSNSSSR